MSQVAIAQSLTVLMLLAIGVNCLVEADSTITIFNESIENITSIESYGYSFVRNLSVALHNETLDTLQGIMTALGGGRGNLGQANLGAPTRGLGMTLIAFILVVCCVCLSPCISFLLICCLCFGADESQNQSQAGNGQIIRIVKPAN